MVFKKIPTINLIENPLCVTDHFLLLLSSFFVLVNLPIRCLSVCSRSSSWRLFSRRWFSKHQEVFSHHLSFHHFFASSLLGFTLSVCWYTWWCPISCSGSVYFSLDFPLRVDILNEPIFKFTDFFCPYCWTPIVNCLVATILLNWIFNISLSIFCNWW
jgi:hypothetical protein